MAATRSPTPLARAATWLARHLRGTQPAEPADVALERLGYAERYREPVSSALYCGVVSTIVRSYIEDQFHMPAREMTTAEFLADLRDDAPRILQENRPTLERVLACCDIAQADRYELSDAELTSAHAAAVHLIMATRAGSSAPPEHVDYADPPGGTCSARGQQGTQRAARRRWG